MQISEMKVAVTGAASGMGRTFALNLARLGAGVAACDVDAAALETLAAEAKDLPGTLRTYRADVADEASVIAWFDAAWSDFAGLDGLINNAGIFRDALLVRPDKTTGTIRTMSLAHWQQVIDIDLTGPFLATREFAARVVEHAAGPAVVINISSISRHGNMGQGNYSAAKAGLVADTVTWARELARYNIRVAAIAPGFIDTPILAGMRDDALQKMLSGIPLRRLGTAEEIFAGVRFICECDYFTGRCLDIDGGLRL